MTLNHTTNSGTVTNKGRLINQLHRQQNRHRQQSMLMRSIQTIEQVKDI